MRPRTRALPWTQLRLLPDRVERNYRMGWREKLPDGVERETTGWGGERNCRMGWREKLPDGECPCMRFCFCSCLSRLSLRFCTTATALQLLENLCLGWREKPPDGYALLLLSPLYNGHICLGWRDKLLDGECPCMRSCFSHLSYNGIGMFGVEGETVAWEALVRSRRKL